LQRPTSLLLLPPPTTTTLPLLLQSLLLLLLPPSLLPLLQLLLLLQVPLSQSAVWVAAACPWVTGGCNVLVRSSHLSFIPLYFIFQGLLARVSVWRRW
jgi:hypothetical protein